MNLQYLCQVQCNNWIEAVGADNLLNSINPGHRPPAGFDLHRNTWCLLNRVRTSHGRCGDSPYKWDKINSLECDCGAVKQTIKHIAFECPLRSYQGPKIDSFKASPSFIDWLETLDLKLRYQNYYVIHIIHS